MNTSRATKTRNCAGTSYYFNFGCFMKCIIGNFFSLLVAPALALAISVISYVLKLEDINSFSFCSAFSSVIYDWAYDDVLISILGIGVILLLGYLASFEEDAKRYLKRIAHFLPVFKCICFIVCGVLFALAIIYEVKYSGVVSENLIFFDIFEGCGLVVCVLLQSFSHPQNYFSPHSA